MRLRTARDVESMECCLRRIKTHGFTFMVKMERVQTLEAVETATQK